MPSFVDFNNVTNDNKYFINDIKGHQYTLNLYTTKIYNNLNNFSNL